MRLPTRNRWVSTAMVGSPKAMLSTTLAVFRPTPGSFSSSSRERGTSATVVCDQLFRQRDNVLCLGAIKPNGLDVIPQLFFAERHHLLRRIGDGEQMPGGLVDTDVSCLRRQRYCNQQRVGIEMLKFALGLRVGLLEATEGFVHFFGRPRLRLEALGLGALALGSLVRLGLSSLHRPLGGFRSAGLRLGF